MKREIIGILEALSVFEVQFKAKLEDGWIMDPWLHSNGRPWTVTTPDATYLVANMVLLEEGDDPTDPEWIAKHATTVNVPTPTFRLVEPEPEIDPEDAVIYTQSVPHGEEEQAKWFMQGYLVDPDKIYAKNVIMVRRGDVQMEIIEGLNHQIIDLQNLVDRLTVERNLAENTIELIAGNCTRETEVEIKIGDWITDYQDSLEKFRNPPEPEPEPSPEEPEEDPMKAEPVSIEEPKSEW